MKDLRESLQRFCQDDLAEYFVYQRAQGRWSDKPTAAEFQLLQTLLQLLKEMLLVVILAREPNGTTLRSHCQNNQKGSDLMNWIIGQKIDTG